MMLLPSAVVLIMKGDGPFLYGEMFLKNRNGAVSVAESYMCFL